MPLKVFSPGEEIKSSEINDNYKYLEDEIDDVRNQPANIADKSIEENKLNFQAAVINPAELYDKTKITAGRYVNYLNGTLPSREGYNLSDYIPVTVGKRYVVSGTAEQMAFYSAKAQANFVSGLISASFVKDTVVPEGANYLRLSIKDTELDLVSVKEAWALTNDNFTAINVDYLAAQLNIKENDVITVKKDGTGNYTRLRDAIAAAQRYTTIEIYPGTYNLTEEYTEDEINATTFQGFLKDRDVTLKGVGPRGSIILSADLTGYTTTTINRVSTIHIRASGDIDNLTAIGKSTRYAMHDDDGWSNAKKRFSRCDFIKQGTSGGYAQAVGGGTYSGSEHDFADCSFATDWNDVPVSYHNNVNFSMPSRVTFTDCNYTTTFTYQIRFGSLGSGMKDEISLIGNRFTKVHVKEEKLDGVGIDFIMRGRGNREFSIDVQSTVSDVPDTDFVEEVPVNSI
ncbi:hypothetical protein [Enterococcus larvae]|uniref:hypothetical protein n=1 Tax=Enterococcus larvae TaxID=2794352 RepID=UPI003F2B04E9